MFPLLKQSPRQCQRLPDFRPFRAVAPIIQASRPRRRFIAASPAGADVVFAKHRQETNLKDRSRLRHYSVSLAFSFRDAANVMVVPAAFWSVPIVADTVLFSSFF